MNSPFTRAGSPELVLFDLDGTLIDSVPGLALAVDRMLTALGRPPAGEHAVRGWVGNGAPMLVRRALCGAVEVGHGVAEVPEGVAEAEGIAEAEGGKAGGIEAALQDEALRLFLDAYADCATIGTQLYPGVRPFVDELRRRQLPMAIVTNKPARFVPDILQALGLQSHFQLLIGGDTLSNKKPHPEPLLHAGRQFNLSSAQMLMIGDSINDVQAARRAQVPVACVSYGYNHGAPITDSQPDWVVDSLMELL